MNATFNAKVKETWQWFMGTQGGYAGLTDDINTYCSRIAEAAKADARRWKGQPTPDGGQAVTDNSDMESCKKTVLRHLSAKINWLGTRHHPRRTPPLLCPRAAARGDHHGIFHRRQQ